MMDLPTVCHLTFCIPTHVLIRSSNAVAVYRHPSQQLSIPLLAQLLQHVSLEQRLQACAAVCTEWHTAAVMATQDITYSDDFDALSEPETLLLSEWLQKYASHPAVINSIKLHCLRTKLVLPVQQLPALSNPGPVLHNPVGRRQCWPLAPACRPPASSRASQAWCCEAVGCNLVRWHSSQTCST